MTGFTLFTCRPPRDSTPFGWPQSRDSRWPESRTVQDPASGLSPATPYNLLGSKAEILRLVVRQDFKRFTDRLAGVASAGPLDHLLRAADLVVTHYEADRPFHRGLFRAAFSADVAEVRDMMSLEGQALWRGWVDAAQAAGDLADWVRPGPLTVVLIRTIGSTAQTWLSEGWPRERFELEMRHSARLILAGVVAPVHRPAVAAGIASAQAAIAGLLGERPPPPP